MRVTLRVTGLYAEKQKYSAGNDPCSNLAVCFCNKNGRIQSIPECIQFSYAFFFHLGILSLHPSAYFIKLKNSFSIFSLVTLIISVFVIMLPVVTMVIVAAVVELFMCLPQCYYHCTKLRTVTRSGL